MELLTSFCLCFLKKPVRQDGVYGAVTVLEREQQGVEVDVLAIQVGLRSVQRRGDDMLGSAVHAGSVPGEAECQLDPAG
ncbi:hypothetical protein [Pseudomonas aeruginosa]|uniref:hypothetical protein n=1 Tax=Pseudomonas aeruginosa TaxID=287 RepID=UPI0039B78984